MKMIVTMMLLLTSLTEAGQSLIHVKGRGGFFSSGVGVSIKYEEGVGLWLAIPSHVVTGMGREYEAYATVRGKWERGSVEYVAPYDDLAFMLVPVSIDKPNVYPLLTTQVPSEVFIGSRNGSTCRVVPLKNVPDRLYGAAPNSGDSGSPVVTANGELVGIVVAASDVSDRTSQCFGPNCPNPNFGFQIGLPQPLPQQLPGPNLNSAVYVPSTVIIDEWGRYTRTPRPYIREGVAAVTLPPFRQGPPGPTGPPGSAPATPPTATPPTAQLTVEEVNAIVDKKLEAYVTGQEVQAAINLLRNTVVPVRVLREDKTIYSEDAERRLMDPIEIIAPEG